MAEAATADMIIIGVHEGRALPETVDTWMEQWIALRKGRPGALVAVLVADLKTPDASGGILAQLKQASALGRMDFFATRAKEGRDAWLAQGASDVIRQFVLARKNGTPDGLTGGTRMPAEICNYPQQFRQS